MDNSGNDIVKQLHQQEDSTKIVDDGKLHIFVSHKVIDKEVAEKIKSRLIQYGSPQRMEIFLSEEIPIGEKWNEKVHIALKRADWLIFIYTDPSLEWDWCLYETGFFAGKVKTNNSDRLVCLYALDTKIPAPLRGWQAVLAQEEPIRQLLNRIYTEKPRPGIPAVRPDINDDLEWQTESAKMIVSSLKPAPTKEYYSNYIKLYLNQSQIEEFKKKTEKSIPEDVIVDGAFEGNAMDLFDLKKGVFKWSDFYTSLKERKQDGWVDELCVQLSRILNRKPIHRQLLPTFTAKGHRTFYSPVIHLSEWVKGNSLKLWLLCLPTMIPPSNEVIHTHPYIRIAYGENGRIVEANSDAEILYGEDPLKGISLEKMVEILQNNMLPSQKDAFNEEQAILIGKLVAGIKPLNATVCLVFEDQPDKAFLPVITKYFKRQGERYIDVIYLDVSKNSKKDDNGIIISQFK